MDSFLRNNNVVRLIAIVLAVMLWLVVRTGSEPVQSTPTQPDQITETITGTAEVLVAQGQMSLVGGAPEVTIPIHGDRLSVWQTKMLVNQIKFIVDARNLGEGLHEIPVKAEGLPPGVTQDSRNVAIRLEPNLKQTYKVDLLLDNAQDTERLAAIHVQPAEVTITGPSSALQQINKVQARVPSTIFNSSKMEQTVLVYAVNGNGKTLNLSIQPKTVDVEYVPPIEKKTFSKLPIEVKGLTEGNRTELPADGISLTLEGKTEDLAAVQPENIKITIDVTGLAPGEYNRDATITVPESVKVTDKQPIQIPVKIIPENQGTP